MGSRWAEIRVFFGQVWRNYHTTGAVWPSGRRLAAALARYVATDGPPKRILEAGPGTGAVTRTIAKAMRPEDRLDLVELNDSFVACLTQGLADDPMLKQVADRTRVLHCAVEALPGESPYDVIVSGLPLNNFSAAAVECILGKFAELLRPGGTLSFFEYMAMRPLRAVVSGPAGRERLRGVGRAMAAVLSAGEVRRDWVWANIPPAWVHHVRFGAAP
jgi:phospholipid N-methyltransferase